MVPKLDAGHFEAGIEKDPYLNQWTQPDSIIPDLNNPQSLNRYMYVLDDPINATGPTGHKIACDDGYLGSCGDTAYGDDPAKPLSDPLPDPWSSDRGNSRTGGSNSPKPTRNPMPAATTPTGTPTPARIYSTSTPPQNPINRGKV